MTNTDRAIHLEPDSSVLPPDERPEPVLAWYFGREDGITHFRRDVRITPGLVITCRTSPMLCKHGPHASIRPIDALEWGWGPMISRVRMHGPIIIHGDDKLVATSREHLWIADATVMLHAFALWCATQALDAEREAGRDPDQRLWSVLEVKQRWLTGDADGWELTSARSDAASVIQVLERKLREMPSLHQSLLVIAASQSLAAAKSAFFASYLSEAPSMPVRGTAHLARAAIMLDRWNVVQRDEFERRAFALEGGGEPASATRE